MPELILFLLIGLPTLALVFVLLRWAVEREKRAQAREEMDRVYYLRRGVKEPMPEFERRPDQESGQHRT